MGNVFSHPEAVSVIVKDFDEYCKAVMHGLRTMHDTVSRLAAPFKVDIVPLSAEHTAQYNDLNRRKLHFVGEVEVFAGTIAEQLRIVRGRLPKKDLFTSIASCYDGFDEVATGARASELQVQCTDLQADYEKFAVEFNRAYGKAVNAAKVQRVVTGIAFTVAAIACVALIVLHVVPVVNFTLAPAFACFLATASLSSLTSATAVFLSESELERANRFLKDIGSSLRELKHQLTQVRMMTAALTMADREECGACVDKLIHQCDAIVKQCKTM
jgi:hypothetical protein